MRIALLGTGFGQVHAAIYMERDVEVGVFGRGGKRCAYLTPMMGCEVALDAPSSRLPGRGGQRSEVSALVG
jgi:hypothetical protein